MKCVAETHMNWRRVTVPSDRGGTNLKGLLAGRELETSTVSAAASVHSYILPYVIAYLDTRSSGQFAGNDEVLSHSFRRRESTACY